MSQNIYALLDSDEEVSAPKKTVTPAEKGAAPAVDKKPVRDNATRGDRENAPRGRGVRGRGRGGRGGRREPREGGFRERNAEGSYDHREPREHQEGQERRRNFERRGREFDRRSGTGRGREIKKGGGGRGNWGTEEQEADAAQAEVNAENAVETADGAVPEVESGEPAGEEAVEGEPEPAVMTLEEYMTKKKETERVGEAFAQLEVRAVDESEFAGAKVLTKEGKTPDFVESQYERVFRDKKSGRKKVVVENVGFRSAAPEQAGRDGGRGGRGPRREGRGEAREGRGEARGEGRNQGGRGGRGGRGSRGRGESTPNVADTSAFPALS